MAIYILVLLLLIAGFFISGKFTFKAVNIIFRVVSFLWVLVMLYKNREYAIELGNRVLYELIPFLFAKTEQLFHSLISFASNSSERMLNELNK